MLCFQKIFKSTIANSGMMLRSDVIMAIAVRAVDTTAEEL